MSFLSQKECLLTCGLQSPICMKGEKHTPQPAWLLGGFLCKLFEVRLNEGIGSFMATHRSSAQLAKMGLCLLKQSQLGGREEITLFFRLTKKNEQMIEPKHGNYCFLVSHPFTRGPSREDSYKEPLGPILQFQILQNDTVCSPNSSNQRV